MINQYINELINCKIFNSIDKNDFFSMLSCLQYNIKSYKKNEFIVRPGSIIHSIGIVLNGSVIVSKDDYWGNRAIISKIEKSQVFGEVYACQSHSPVDISVNANSDAVIMFIDIERIFTPCSSACSFHNRLIQNLVMVLAGKNLLLTNKMEHMSKKTIREKLLSYLSEQSTINGSGSFDIPFNRQQLADYLCVDRSALSNEISKLQIENILKCNKSHFELI